MKSTYNSNVKACKQAARLICLHIFLWLLLCYNCRVEKLWQKLDGLQSLRYVLSGLLQKIVCWPLFYVIYTFRCNVGFWIFFSENFLNFFFSRKNTTAILLWKNSDSLGWFEMTLLVSPACNSASLSHLNTLELSLDGKARSYCPTCPPVIHLVCVMGLVSQHYEFIQASWIIYRDFHIPSQTLTHFLRCEFFFQQKAESMKWPTHVK